MRTGESGADGGYIWGFHGHWARGGRALRVEGSEDRWPSEQEAYKGSLAWCCDAQAGPNPGAARKVALGSSTPGQGSLHREPWSVRTLETAAVSQGGGARASGRTWRAAAREHVSGWIESVSPDL